MRITEVREASSSTLTHTTCQAGLSVSASHPVLDAGSTVGRLARAAGDTDDARMPALAAASAALTVNEAAAAMANPAKANASINLTLGSSKQTSRTQEQADTAAGSTVAAGGNLSVVATGGGADSTLRVRGSRLSAGEDALLQADGRIDLLAAQSTRAQQSRSSGSSTSIGVGFSTGAQSGVTFNAGASRSKGQADGQEQVHTHTQVSAGNALVVQSGGDTTLRGAVIDADTVRARIGGHLTIESPQDTSTYESRQTSAGVGVSLCVPPLCAGSSSASVSAGRTRIDSTYASVGEQSAIRAGDGGFDVQVEGRTSLTGGAITSTDAAVQAGANTFTSREGVQLQDVNNQAGYSGRGVALTLGKGVDTQGTPTATSRGAGFGSDSGSAQSVTRAGISGVAGDTAARTGDAQTGIAPIFDAERVQREIDAQVTITQHALPQLFRAAGTYADRQRDDLRTRARGEVDPQRQAELNAQAGRWEEGGDFRVALHSAIGLLGGDVAGAVGSGAAAAAAPALEQLQNGVSVALADAGLTPALAREVASGVASVAAAGIGGITTGGALAGAATGMNVDANNRQLHAAEERWLKDRAKDFARQEGISEDEALRRLTQQALKDVDFLWRAQLADGDDAKAQAFLAGAEQTFTNDLGAQQRLFTATGQQLLRPEMFADTADPAFYRQFAQSGISRSLSAGLAKELRDSGIDVARGAVDLARTARDNPGLVVNAVWETVRTLPHSVVDGFKESGTSIGEGTAVALTPALASKVDALYGSDTAGAQRALLAIRVAAAVTGTAGTAKMAASAADATAVAVARKLDDALDQKALEGLLKSGGVHDRSGNPLLDLKQLTDAQKGAMGDLFGANTVKQIVPDGQKIARVPGVGETGIDDLYKVNRPDVDYVVIEYKFVGDPKRSGSSALGSTADGRQGSIEWITGSNRLGKAVGDDTAHAVNRAAQADRIETWVVTTKADGSTLVQVLDAKGAVKAIDTSRVLAPTRNLSGATP
ncbi:hemagglutinin repeat-containing protein [Ramlibacter rhizophilus]|uniref:Uncharacterized protein n=1 Tax=Ramlibacter rhizophilus TaxID=1781167 RepID=A0A4Z0BDE7_9BURK|nr:hemagglutinin repeat-containing protein [Ramlibacter rhizophilus]TFY97335.1 hypothetical protein EZ242_17565 [Ramlibacter rhizophilus]